MPQIKLQARLQAYSRAPFYGDYIRDPKSLVPDYNSTTIYVFKDGSWIDLADAASDTGLSINELKTRIDQVEASLLDDVRTVSCYIDYDKLGLIFVDSNNQEHFYSLPSANVDNITIGTTVDNKLTLLDTPDEKSIKVVDVTFSEDPILGVNKKVSGKLRADALYAGDDSNLNIKQEDIADFTANYISGYDIKTRLQKLEKNVTDIEQFVQGTGGFLDPYNFSQSLVNLDEELKNSILNNYAYEQLFQGQPREIPDQTKIKNIYTGNIWVFIQDKNTWINEGQDTIVTATNDGVLGSVTGVEYNIDDTSTKFKISIEKDEKGQSTGIMSVNGLEEEFDKVIYRTETDANSALPETYVLRTQNGTIVANDSISNSDVINQGQFNAWLQNTSVSADEVLAIVNALYFPEFGDADGDGDIDIDWGSSSFDDGTLEEVY